MKISYKKDYLILIFTFLLFFTATVLQAQEPDVEAFKEAMKQDKRKNAFNGDSADGYKSFVQNEFSNIFSNQKDLDDEEIQDITFAEINSKRIEYAIQLCQRDQRACFLIDEYQSYKSSEDLPKKFEDLKLFGHEIFSGYSNEFNFYDSLHLDDKYNIKIGD